VIEAEQRLSDMETIKQRPTLKLPEAQVTASTLAEVAKYKAKQNAGGETDRVTDALVDGTMIGSTPAPVTIQTPGSRSNLMKEAQYLNELNSQKTPLLGGEETPLTYKSDYSSATPKSTVTRTPNPLLMSVDESAQTPGVGRTPLFATPGSTPGRTPGGKRNKRGQKRKRKDLKDAFDLLPKPHNDYEIVRPEVSPEELVHQMEEDAMDIELRKEQQRLRQRELELKRRSKVMQRNLERPKKICTIRTSMDDKNKFLAMAAKWMDAEMKVMMSHDNEAFPLNGKAPKSRKRRKFMRREYSDESLAEADKLLSEEMEKLKKEKNEKEVPDFENFSKKADDQCMFIPTKDRFDFIKKVTMRERLQTVRQQFALLREQLKLKMKKGQKLEKQLQTYYGGYLKIANNAKLDIKNKYNELIQVDREVHVFGHLEKMERKAMPKRLKEWKGLVTKEKEREQEVQKRYGDLKRELLYLTKLLN